VWVTGQALAALARRPFPIARVARVANARSAPAPAPVATATAAATVAPVAPKPRRAPRKRAGLGVATPRNAVSEAALEALARRAGATAALLTSVVL
jgi:hypothetical protein